MKVKAGLLSACLGLIPALFSCPTTPPSGNGGETITVSRELYNRTFGEVLHFLKQMDAIIAARDFKAWKAQCTAGFLAAYSDPMRLHELSQKPNLKDRRIVLRSLEDYFYFVFIPSRVETKLDKLDFTAKNRVKAVAVIDDKPYVVYFLEKDENNIWKIGVW
jgi:hypothetical protein